MSRRKTHEEFIKEVYELVGDEYTVLSEYVTQLIKVKFRHNCDNCDNYEFEMLPTNFLQGKRCPYCSKKLRKDTELFKKIVYKMVQDEYTVFGEYINAKTKIKFRHNCEFCNNYEFEMTPDSFMQGCRCPYCGHKKDKGKTHETFIQEIFDKYGDEYLVVDRYKGDRVKIKIKHKTCGNIFEMTPNQLLNIDIPCMYCKNYTKALAYINDIYTTNPYLASLLKNPDDAHKYKEHSNEKVDWICPKCGEIIINKRIVDVNRRGLYCKKCSDGVSYPEKILYSVLEQLKVDFETEKYFIWCRYKYKNKIKKGLYDFYFIKDGLQYVLEVDGGFHRKDNPFSGQTKKESLFFDMQKDRLAREHNIEPIRIECDESNIKSLKQHITNSRLNDLFNLSNINWDECNRYALTSDMINICQQYNNGVSIKDLSKKYHKDENTIVRYLHKGNTVGYCNYNPYDSFIKNILKAIEKLKKPVVCINTNEYFDSISEAQRFYSIYNIDNVCRGKYKSAGKLPDGTKLRWRYATQEEILLHQLEVKNN